MSNYDQHRAVPLELVVLPDLVLIFEEYYELFLMARTEVWKDGGVAYMFCSHLILLESLKSRKYRIIHLTLRIMGIAKTLVNKGKLLIHQCPVVLPAFIHNQEGELANVSLSI